MSFQWMKDGGGWPRSGQAMGRKDGQTDGQTRGKGAGAPPHTQGAVGGPDRVCQLPAPAAARAPPPQPAQSAAGIEAAIPNPSVTLV